MAPKYSSIQPYCGFVYVTESFCLFLCLDHALFLFHILGISSRAEHSLGQQVPASACIGVLSLSLISQLMQWNNCSYVEVRGRDWMGLEEQICTLSLPCCNEVILVKTKLCLAVTLYYLNIRMCGMIRIEHSFLCRLPPKSFVLTTLDPFTEVSFLMLAQSVKNLQRQNWFCKRAMPARNSREIAVFSFWETDQQRKYCLHFAKQFFAQITLTSALNYLYVTSQQNLNTVRAAQVAYFVPVIW